MQVTAVLDVAEQNRDRAKELLPAAKFYTDIDAFLRSEQLDFVDICSPPHTHAGYIALAVGRGLHIVCEKPLAHRFDVAEAIAANAGNGKVVFVPCHQYKYSPLWSKIHEIISAGTLGDISLAQFGVYRLQADTGTASWQPGWRTSREHSGGGILADTGAHYFYLAQYFFGMPKKVSSVLRTLKHREYGVEDTAVVTLEYPSTLMQVNLTWAAGLRANSVFIAGTAGSLSYDGQRLLHADAAGVREIPMPDVSDKNQYISWYASLFGEFRRRVEEKQTTPDLLNEAVNVMKLLDCSTRASDTDAVLEVR